MNTTTKVFNSVKCVAIISFCLLLFILLSGCAHEVKKEDQENRDVQLKSRIKTEEDYLNKEYQWLLRNIMDSYEKEEIEKSKWDASVRSFIKDSVRFQARQKNAPTSVELESRGRKLVQNGCDSGTVLCWFGIMLHNNDKHDESAKILKQIIDGGGLIYHISPILRFYGYRSLTNALYEMEGTQLEAYKYRRRTYSTLGNIIVNGYFSGKDVQIVHRIIRRTYRKPFNEMRWVRVYEQISHGKTVDPFILRLLEGRREISLAWEERGSGWASEVTEEGWKGFKTHLEKARGPLIEAWKMHPEYPEAVAEMIKVTGAGHGVPGEPDHLWFARSITAQIDYIPAYNSMLWFLRPRWGGTLDAMLQFGLDCLNGERFDTDVPFVYLSALRDVASEIPDNNWREVFRRSETIHNLDRLFNGMLAEPSRKKDRNRILTQKALTKAWGGDYTTANKILKQVGEKINLRNGFAWSTLSWSGRPRSVVNAELEAFTGPHKETLKNAEKESMKGRVGDAIALFKQVMDYYEKDPDIHAYLRDRIAYLQLRVKATFNRATSGWTTLHLAADNGRLPTVKFLVQNNADIEVRKDNGSTAIYLAARKGHTEVVRYLLEKSANPSIIRDGGFTPLYMAINREHLHAAILLINSGADPNTKTDEGGWTPLHVAVKKGYTKIVKMLLDSGADPLVKLQNGKTPLKLAQRGNHTEIVRLLSLYSKKRPAPPVKAAIDVSLPPIPKKSSFLGKIDGETYKSVSPPARPPLLRWDFSSRAVYPYDYNQKVRISSQMHGIQKHRDNGGTSIQSIEGSGLISLRSMGNHTAHFVLDEFVTKLKIKLPNSDELKTVKRKSPQIAFQDVRENGSMKIGNSQQELLLKTLFPIPPKPLRVGESVTIPAEMPFNVMGFPLIVTGSSEITLADYVEIKGKMCAKLVTQINITNPKISPKIKGEYNCQVKGKSVFFFDLSGKHFMSGNVAVLMCLRAEKPSVKAKSRKKDSKAKVADKIKIAMDSDNFLSVNYAKK